jgi:hypothetical protein
LIRLGDEDDCGRDAGDDGSAKPTSSDRFEQNHKSAFVIRGRCGRIEGYAVVEVEQAIARPDNRAVDTQHPEAA